MFKTQDLEQTTLRTLDDAELDAVVGGGAADWCGTCRNPWNPAQLPDSVFVPLSPFVQRVTLT